MKLTITADLRAKGDLAATFAKDLEKAVKSTLPDDAQAVTDADVKVTKVTVKLE